MTVHDRLSSFLARKMHEFMLTCSSMIQNLVYVSKKHCLSALQTIQTGIHAAVCTCSAQHNLCQHALGWVICKSIQIYNCLRQSNRICCPVMAGHNHHIQFRAYWQARPPNWSSTSVPGMLHSCRCKHCTHAHGKSFHCAMRP